MEILKSIKIVNYRSVLDEEIKLDNMLAFIGANESGKSNILNAINHLAKEKQFESFKQEELNLCIGNHKNNHIELEYEVVLHKHLIPRLAVHIPELLGKTVLLKKKGSVGEEPSWSIKVSHVSNIGNMVFIKKKTKFKEQLAKSNFSTEQINRLTEDKYFFSSHDTNLTKRPFFNLKKDGVIEVFKNNKKQKKIEDLLLDELCNNIKIYFWKYDVKNYLEENIRLEEFCKKPRSNRSVYGVFKIAKDEGAFDFHLNAGDLTSNLLNTSGVSRKNLLNEISKFFNKIFKKSWKTYFGKSTLNLIINYEDNNLSFRFNDGIECPPEYRSDGLKWFLTFLINFQSKQKDLSNYILIMDEPGGLLHPQGQKDALEFLLKLSKKNQIFYSTHQTFMIDKNNPQSVRILDRKKKDTKLDFWPTLVHEIKNNYTHILRDSLLRESLGFTLSDISPINEKNILVEGTFDRSVIQLCNDHYKIIDMNFYSVIDCGKASNIQFQAEQYINSGLKVLCLYDNDSVGKQSYDNNKKVNNDCKKLISDEQGKTMEDILPKNVFEEAFKKLTKDKEYKQLFNNKTIVTE